MYVRWPFANVYHSSPLSPALRTLALEQLREAGIEAAHNSEREELVDIITGQGTGYMHCAEIFVVADSDGPRARQILEQALGPCHPPQGSE